MVIKVNGREQYCTACQSNKVRLLYRRVIEYPDRKDWVIGFECKEQKCGIKGSITLRGFEFEPMIVSF